MKPLNFTPINKKGLFLLRKNATIPLDGCVRCGFCCTIPFPITNIEMKRISKIVNVEKFKKFEKGQRTLFSTFPNPRTICPLINKEEVFLNLQSIVEKNEKNKLLLIGKNKSNSLLRFSSCSIYHEKPIACSFYPFNSPCHQGAKYKAPLMNLLTNETTKTLEKYLLTLSYEYQNLERIDLDEISIRFNTDFCDLVNNKITYRFFYKPHEIWDNLFKSRIVLEEWEINVIKACIEQAKTIKDLKRLHIDYDNCIEDFISQGILRMLFLVN